MRMGEDGGGIGGHGEDEGMRGYAEVYVYIYILSHTLTYLYIPSNTPEYLYIPLYTPIYIKISNIRKMRSDIRPQNGHNSGPRASPMARIWHAPSYHTPNGFFMSKRPRF